MALSMGLLGGAAYRNGDFELISTTVLGSSANSVTFANLNVAATQYKHLQLRMVYGSNNGGSGTYVRGQFNGDSSSTYRTHYLYGQGSAALAGASTLQPTMLFSPVSGTTASNQMDAVIADIFDFKSTSKNKVSKIIAGGPGYGSANLISNVWLSNSAITSLTLFAYSQGAASTFGVGSRFSMYGLRG